MFSSLIDGIDEEARLLSSHQKRKIPVSWLSQIKRMARASLVHEMRIVIPINIDSYACIFSRQDPLLQGHIVTRSSCPMKASGMKSLIARSVSTVIILILALCK
jgi:hypothetical protein